MLSNQQQTRKSSKTLLQHYRGGSQSLSTTPVREIVCGTARALQEDRIAKALLDVVVSPSEQPKGLKRRCQQATVEHCDGNNGFTQPSALLPASTISNLQAAIHQQQQQQIAYTNQLAAAAYLNPILPGTSAAWLQNLYQTGAAASLLSIGGGNHHRLMQLGTHPSLINIDSARLLAAIGGGGGGESVPKVARTE